MSWTWDFDVPKGVYKNDHLTDALRYSLYLQNGSIVDFVPSGEVGRIEGMRFVGTNDPIFVSWDRDSYGTPPLNIEPEGRPWRVTTFLRKFRVFKRLRLYKAEIEHAHRKLRLQESRHSDLRGRVTTLAGEVAKLQRAKAKKPCRRKRRGC